MRLLAFYVLDNHVLRFLGQHAFVEDDVPLSLRCISTGHVTLFGPGASSCRRRCEHRPSRVDSGAAEHFCSSLLWGGSLFFLCPVTPEAGALWSASFPRPGDPYRAILEDCVQRTQAIVWFFLPLGTLILPSLLLAIYERSHLVVLSRQCSQLTTSTPDRSAQGGSCTIPLMDELIPLFQGGGVVLCSVQSRTCCLPCQSLRIALGCFAVMAILLQGVISQVFQLTAEFRSAAPLATRILEHLHGDDLVVHEGP